MKIKKYVGKVVEWTIVIPLVVISIIILAPAAFLDGYFELDKGL